MDLTFLGAAETVTGSKYLVRFDSKTVLIDCGLFQGLKRLRLKNWTPLPVDPASIDAVILTHAHLDHSGYLPVLIRDGFRGPVYSTPATFDICKLLLPDSGHLLEEDAAHANRYGYSKHHPALPLYTRAEAEASLQRFHTLDFHATTPLGESAHFTLRRAGHIPGSSIVTLEAEGRTLVVSGDVGRPTDAMLLAPETVTTADYLVVESTYGDREHVDTDPQIALADVVNRTVKRGGTVIIPAFAVGRTQLLLYYLHALLERGAIPRIPVYIDSPMAADATRLLLTHSKEHKLTKAQIDAIRQLPIITNTVDDSKAIDRRTGPMIVISASGMATGGRVLFHLERFAPEPRNTILFAGHQAVGTRGAAMVAGADSIKMHGREVPIRAEVALLAGLSAHADASELIDWLRNFRTPPHTTFITHGEPVAADALRRRIVDALGWSVSIPQHGEQVCLK